MLPVVTWAVAELDQLDHDCSGDPDPTLLLQSTPTHEVSPENMFLYPLWSSSLHRHRRQGTSSGRVRVQYINSDPNSLSRNWLNKQIVWIEVCSAYPWGHRADRTHYNDPCGGAHICWEDLAPCCKDRPFAHDHCSGGASWCPVYGRSRSWFGNRGGRRGGYVRSLGRTVRVPAGAIKLPCCTMLDRRVLADINVNAMIDCSLPLQ